MYLHLTPSAPHLQDGMFHKKKPQRLEEMPMERCFKKWYNKYVGQKETARRFLARWTKLPWWRLFCFLRLRSVQIPEYNLRETENTLPAFGRVFGVFSSRNPGSSWPGWGGGVCGWPCFRSGGSVHGSRRRSGPPLPGCGCGRRTCRSACAARPLPAR